jgi:squalene-associated FAD-dependent desaturase
MEARKMRSPHVIVVGGGLAGLSASVSLANRGFRVSLLERSPRLGGRASSYLLPNGEQIDNCQHVTLGCCSNLADFYSRIGVADKIRHYDELVFADSSSRRARIRSSRLPAPFHLLPSFAAFRLLTRRDKLSIARAMLSILTAGGKPRLPGSISMLNWLKQQKQTQPAIDRFWSTVLVSALNEDLERIDANYGISVFWKSFLSSSEGFRIGIPSVPLSELYASCNDCITMGHGEVRTRTGVAQIRMRGNEVHGVTLDDGEEMDADYYILAVTFDRLLKMLPESMRSHATFENLSDIPVSPITSVHLWFDRPVMTEPFLASLDHTTQWVFNKTRLSGSGAQTGLYLQLVISASRSLSNRSQQDIVALCRSELEQLLPATREAKLVRSVVIRENAATFSPQPGCNQWRPTQRTSIRNLFLAGDWTQTGWPATMESAVRSGYQAAEAVLAQEGRPLKIVQPEIPATGLARWFTSAGDTFAEWPDTEPSAVGFALRNR